jgi:hypothetical protein
MEKFDQKIFIFLAIGVSQLIWGIGVCLQKFGGSRPAGLGGDSIKGLSQIIL